MNDFVSGRRRWATVVLAGVAYLSGSAPLAADPFINLTFDEPTLAGPFRPLFPGGPLEGTVDDILTGWDVLVDGQLQSRMVYIPPGAGAAAGFAYLYHSGASDFFGKYSLLLRSPFPNPPDVRIRQTGTIPEDMTHLWIASAGIVFAFVDGVSVGGVNPELGSWAFLDISPYQGREVQLEFSIAPGRSAFFDIIGFTNVPEPSTWALAGVGALGLGWAAIRSRRGEMRAGEAVDPQIRGDSRR